MESERNKYRTLPSCTWPESAESRERARQGSSSLENIQSSCHPLMTTPGCFCPYHNSQLLVFSRGLLTQCGRLTAALFVPNKNTQYYCTSSTRQVTNITCSENFGHRNESFPAGHEDRDGIKGNALS